MSQPACPPPPATPEQPALVRAFTSLPCVSETIRAVTTFNIEPVTRLLESAAYFPLLVAADGRGTAAGYEVRAEPRRFALATGVDGCRGRLVGRDRAGNPVARLAFRWRVVPEDYRGRADHQPALPVLPLDPHRGQRVEILDWRLSFADGSGYRAYGTGRTLPGAGGSPGVGFVLDILAGSGRLAGLAGTVVASGALEPPARLRLSVMTRIMDPAGGLSASAPVPPPPPGAGPGVTTLSFLGQVDPQHPVTLRFSFTEGLLGSEVFELLRPATLDFAASPGALASWTSRGPVAGSVSARLSFDPLALCPITPIQTRRGVFHFHDAEGRSLGCLYADMTEGRSFRTRLEGMLLPVFRFGGFGAIAGGTGDFAGARGIMTMNSVISVQPRTLSNLYLLGLDDPAGRWRAAPGQG